MINATAVIILLFYMIIIFVKPTVHILYIKTRLPENVDFVISLVLLAKLIILIMVTVWPVLLHMFWIQMLPKLVFRSVLLACIEVVMLALIAKLLVWLALIQQNAILVSLFIFWMILLLVCHVIVIVMSVMEQLINNVSHVVRVIIKLFQRIYVVIFA